MGHHRREKRTEEVEGKKTGTAMTGSEVGALTSQCLKLALHGPLWRLREGPGTKQRKQWARVWAQSSGGNRILMSSCLTSWFPSHQLRSWRTFTVSPWAWTVFFPQEHSSGEFFAVCRISLPRLIYDAPYTPPRTHPKHRDFRNWAPLPKA